MEGSQQPVPLDTIASKIYLIRGQKIMLDSDLAALYGIATFRFNEAVKRNRKRFPDDFMFQLTAAEYADLTSQIAISNYERLPKRSNIWFKISNHLDP